VTQGVCVSREAGSKYCRSSHCNSSLTMGLTQMVRWTVFLVRVGAFVARGSFLLNCFGRSVLGSGAGWLGCERADKVRPLSCTTEALNRFSYSTV
jgi:hypothetical protein